MGVHPFHADPIALFYLRSHSPEPLSIVQPPYVTQKKCVAADIMIISAVGDKNSSPGRRCERGAAAADYLKDNLCYLCHQDNDRL